MSDTFQVQLTGRITTYRRSLYEIEAETGAEALASVREGGGTLIEEEDVETVDSEDGPRMVVNGVWDSNGEDAYVAFEAGG